MAAAVVVLVAIIQTMVKMRVRARTTPPLIRMVRLETISAVMVVGMWMTVKITPLHKMGATRAMTPLVADGAATYLITIGLQGSTIPDLGIIHSMTVRMT